MSLLLSRMRPRKDGGVVRGDEVHIGMLLFIILVIHGLVAARRYIWLLHQHLSLVVPMPNTIPACLCLGQEWH